MPDAWTNAMGVKRVEDLIAFQRAVLFKEGIYTLVRGNPHAYRDWKWRAQLFDAALGVDSNIAEGWARRGAAQICVFLDYAHGSLDEARKRLDDGVRRGHYTAAQCAPLIVHERICGKAIRRLKASLQPFIPDPPRRRPRRRRPPDSE
jgi:four helix bundle protein